MTKKIYYTYVTLALFIFLSGCYQAEETAYVERSAPGMAMKTQAMDVESVEEESLEEDHANPNFSDRKLIKNGHLRFRTDSFEETQLDIVEAVKLLNGYISNENQSNPGNRISQNLTIRVPSKNFESLIDRILTNAGSVEERSIYVNDVTAQYTDIAARLKTKKALENRYREILKQAKSVRDILDIERELGNIRADIEATEGRLKMMDNQIDYSTLQVYFYKEVYKNEGLAYDLGAGFRKGWENLLSFIIGLIHIWPFLLILGLGVFFLIRFKRNRKR
jgi:hypothetical protein